MNRKFIIRDEGNGEMEFECHIDHPVHAGKNVIVTIKDELSITLETRKILNELITVVNNFMSRNTISQLEVTEIIEE